MEHQRKERRPPRGGEVQYRLLVESISDYAIFLLDPKGRVATWNAGAEHLYGYSESEVLGQPLSHFYSPKDQSRGEPETELKTATDQGRVITDGWHLRKDGFLLWVNTITTAVRDEEGRLRGFARIVRDESDQKAMDRAGSESEEFFHSAIDALSSPLCVLDEQGTILAVNKAWRNFGVPEATWLASATEGGNYLDVCDRARDSGAEQAGAMATGLRAVLSGEREKFSLSYPCHSPDKQRWFLARITRFAGPGPPGVVVIHENATRWKLAENRLRYQLRLTESIASRAAEALFLVDGQGAATYLNPAAEKMVGWKLEELAGKVLHDAIHFMRPDSRPFPFAECPLAQVVKTGRTVQNYEGVFFHRSGRPVKVCCSSAPVVEGDRIYGAVLVASDITRTQQAVEKHSEQLRQLARVSTRVNTIHDAQSILRLITNEARALLSARQAAASATVGQDRPQVIETSSFSNQTAEQPPDAKAVQDPGLGALVCRSNRSVRLTQAELESHPERKQRDKRSAPRGWLAVPLAAGDGRNIGLIELADKEGGEFTEADEAILVQLGQMASVALENARLYEELREADRRKDEFLSMLAHELRNPLAPVLNGLQLLHLGGSDSGVVNQARGMMDRQIGHLSRIIDDLLDVTRITHGQVQLRKEKLDFAHLVRTTAEDYRRIVEQAGLELRMEVTDWPMWVEGDATRLTQILNNFLDNSAKFTQPGGRVIVRLAADRDGRRAVLTVIDTGMGVEPDLLPHLFDVFAQADRSLHRTQGGLGLGLAVVKGLVELHGGEVSASSKGPGQGAEFTVRLPLQEEPAALMPSPMQRPLRGGHLRIVIIEDNRDSADSLRDLLEMLGHEVRVAYSGLDGLKLAGEWTPSVVLSDIGLPGLDGFGVARELRRNQKTADARLIAITGYGSEDDRRRAHENGFDHVITKPADPDALQELLAVAN
ncbi:MAG: PAS domain S-box protein [Gemmataceae bacterium]